MIEFLKTIRTIGLIFLAGTATGAYGAHRIETVPLVKIAVAGACAQPGIQTVSVSLIAWYNCQDSAIANHIQTTDAEVEASRILAEMERNQPKKVRK